MPSTVIRHFEHDPATQQLTVTFTTGRVYVYDNVTDEVAAALRAAASKGAFFNARSATYIPIASFPRTRDEHPCLVIAGPVPAIPLGRAHCVPKRDGRDKRGHDDEV